MLLGADDRGTVAIISAHGQVKGCKGHWQERFMAEDVYNLLSDKTRPPKIAPPLTLLVNKVGMSTPEVAP